MLNSRRDKDGSWGSSYKDIKSGLVYEASELLFNLDYYTVIQGWVAKDANHHSLYVYGCNPIRLSDMWSALGMSFAVQTPSHLFPDLTWDDDPLEVEIILKRKKK